jgi:hypothetical protein
VRKQYDDLIELRVLFANPRLREFIVNDCLPEALIPNRDSNSDKRVGFGEFIARKALARCHETLGRLESGLNLQT